MGGCLGTDVKSKYEVGQATATESQYKADAERAEALISGSAAWATWVMLSLQARQLRDADLLSKSDGMGVLYEWKNNDWVEVGRTEVIANEQNPKFVKSFKVLYNFERIQKYKLLLVDVDKGDRPQTVNPMMCYFLGACEFQLSEVLTAAGKKLVRPLNGKNGQRTESTAVLLAEEESSCKEVFKVKFAASKLLNVDHFSKSDPFLTISRRQEDGTWLPVYKTAVRKDDLSPTWAEVVIRGTQLNNGDMARPLLLQVMDYEANGSHRELGRCQMSTERMQELGSQHGSFMALEPPPGRKPGQYGTLQVLSFAVETRHSFVDYLAGGTEIGFLVAVDFTASNGDPRSPSSKHYFAAGPTQYEQAIMGIGHVIEAYDADKTFPMWGFGGQLGRAPTDHCFAMGPPPDSTCIGINGLLQAYRQALGTWTLSGPTLFAPVIRRACDLARPTIGARPPKYTVLLILTDGAIMDMADTINAVIAASTLPLSILIVGIGNDNFGDMNTLDSDDRRLSNGTRTAVRDIVQFVPFNQFACDGPRLAQELLAELPGQLLEYMRTNNVPCPPPLTAAATMAAASAPPPPGAGGYPQPSAPPPPGAGGYYPQPGAPPPPGAGGYPQPSAPPPAPGAGGYYPQPGAPPPPGAGGYPQPGAPPAGGYPQPSAPPPPPGGGGYYPPP